MASHVASADGTPIAVWRRGRGRPLVLVHGTTADHTRWDALIPFLEPHVDTVAMDRRGRGASGDGPTYSLAKEAEDVAAVVQQEADRFGGPVDLMGHSFGALVALEAARIASPRRMVLYEPVFGWPATGFASRADALMATGDRDGVVELFFREVLQADDAAIASWRAQSAWRIRVAAAHTLAREDRAEQGFRFDPLRLAHVRAPTLLLLGQESGPEFQGPTRRIQAALPDACVAVLPGQGHFAIISAPHLVADVVLPFLLQDPPGLPPS